MHKYAPARREEYYYQVQARESQGCDASHLGPVEVLGSNNMEEGQGLLGRSRPPKPRVMLTAVLTAFAMVLLVILFAQSSTKEESKHIRSAEQAPALPYMGATTDDTDTTDSTTTVTVPKPTPPPGATSCRKATLKECKSLACGEGTPYTCIRGDSKGGCGAGDAPFLNPGCMECVNLQGCSDMVPECDACTQDECDALKNSCGLQHYACLAGKSKGGCSSEADDWRKTYYKGGCTKCCNTAKCPGQVAEAEADVTPDDTTGDDTDDDDEAIAAALKAEDAKAKAKAKGKGKKGKKA